MLHTVLVMTNCGNFYRSACLADCSCSGKHRSASESIRLDIQVGGEAGFSVRTPGHGTLQFLLQDEREAREQGSIVLLPMVTRVHGIESCADGPAVEPPLQQFRAPQIENICGKLPAQDLRLVKCSAARKINKCFGLRFCLYSLRGNISFDAGPCQPQFRGVRDFASFLSFAERFQMDTDGLVVHLIVLSGNLGKRVTVGDQGTLTRLMPRMGGYKTCTGLDVDACNLRFKDTSVSGNDAISIAVTRRGCVVIRACFRPPRELTPEVVADVQRQSASIMQDVVSMS